MKGWLYLFLVMSALLNAISKGMETQRKVDDSRAKRELMKQTAIINETKIARENNKIVLDEIDIDLQLLEIEKKRLELLKQKRALGLDAPEFIPSDYDVHPS